MPCKDPDYNEDQAIRAENEFVVAKLNKVTELLCWVMTTLDPLTKRNITNMKTPNSANLRVWWEKHQEADRLRIEKETLKLRQATLKQQALAKLTKEERKLLGL